MGCRAKVQYLCIALPQKPIIAHLTSVHHAMDTRIFYRYCTHLSEDFTVKLLGLHPKRENVNGVEIIPFKKFRNKFLRLTLTPFLMYAKALKTKAGVFHFHDPELIPCGLLLHWSGKKVIYDVHENIADDIYDKPWIKHKKLLYSFFNYFEKLAAKKFPFILAEYSYESRYKQLRANYTVVLNYPDGDFFKVFAMPERKAVPRLFYIGILLDSRGLLEIAEAIFILQQRNIFVHFDVVGALYSELERALVSLPFFAEVDPYIHFYGRKNLEQGYAVSHEAGIGMCIIQRMKNSEKSYPTKMFEYMHIGLPQIISDFELYQSVVEKHECGICVNPAAPEAIANAIEKLLTDKKLYDSCIKNALLNKEKYDWKTEMRKVKELYLNLAD